MSFLEDSWEEREETAYVNIFGDIGKGIYPLSHEVFDRMNANSIDPHWLRHGVFRCPPVQNRKSWAYVTSGMSNPWESDTPEESSGLGTEFLLETEDETTWGIEVLQTLMAYNLLVAAGKMGDLTPLDYGHRVPLKLSNMIKTMMFTRPINFQARFTLYSGEVDLIQVVGITPKELEFAQENSSEELGILLANSQGNLFTTKERESVV